MSLSSKLHLIVIFCVSHRLSAGSDGFIDCMCAELRGEMDDVEAKMQAVFQSAAADLGLEPHKTVRMESTSQLGHFLRVTTKVCVESSQVHCVDVAV